MKRDVLISYLVIIDTSTVDVWSTWNETFYFNVKMHVYGTTNLNQFCIPKTLKLAILMHFSFTNEIFALWFPRNMHRFKESERRPLTSHRHYCCFFVYLFFVKPIFILYKQRRFNLLLTLINPQGDFLSSTLPDFKFLTLFSLKASIFLVLQ